MGMLSLCELSVGDIAQRKTSNLWLLKISRNYVQHDANVVISSDYLFFFFCSFHRFAPAEAALFIIPIPWERIFQIISLPLHVRKPSSNGHSTVTQPS